MFLTNADVFQPAPVSPHDHAALALLQGNWEMEVTLPNLIRGAARSRRLAAQHKRAAWQFILSARSARGTGDEITHRDCLDDAITARQRAAECNGFARRCEGQANAIAVASGFLR